MNQTDLAPRTARLGLATLLLLRLLLGLTYSALNPLGEAPDEADHYAYAAYIAQEGRLPVGPEMTQGKHPPLYHLLAASAARLAEVRRTEAPADFSFLRANPDVGVTPDAQAANFFIHTRLEAWPWRDGPLAMHAGRLVSVLAGVVLTAAAYALGRKVWPGWYAGPLAAAAFTAFLPEALFVGGAMSNDLLAAMWITLALWLALRKGWLSALMAGLFMGLAMLTKASTAALWPVVCLAMLARVWRETTGDESFIPHFLRAIAPAALAGIVALIVAAPWLGRNQQLYGDPLGWPLVLATIDQRAGPLTLADYGWLARGWFLSFWGKFGGAGHIALPPPFYWVWGAILLAVIAGWAALALHKRRSPASRIAPEGWIIMLGAPIAAVAAIISYSGTALGTDQGRLLFPALAVIGLWIAGGLSAWLPARRGASLPLWVGGGMATVALLALVYGIVRPFAPMPLPAADAIAAATPVAADFGQDVQLVGYQWNGAAPDNLILYWQATRPVETDLRTAVRLLDGDGALLWEWKRSPGAGRLSTDWWPTGRVFTDAYRIPAEVAAGAQRLEIGVRPFPEEAWLPVNGEDALSLKVTP